ncbi:hypothetical protein [Blastococcus sp. TF02A-26]|uniref:hypothetical protein n=1 Tax=Blastococcus sp. TF02A-26 TaxID=2250577 RepID=UPI000DEB39CC|nr:hypothetical protein [Blastococcus sp. TF02A-26]RBY85146.1 hypothetical protein DQ240_13035 [Blastococcus sp. TF02A-26]
MERTVSPLARTLTTAALFVVVLGVLPFVWDADGPWLVFGPLAAAAYAVHAVRVLWRHAFSTTHV